MYLSSLLKKILSALSSRLQVDAPWNPANVVKEIQYLLWYHHVSFSHILRSANGEGDKLTKSRTSKPNIPFIFSKRFLRFDFILYFGCFRFSWPHPNKAGRPLYCCLVYSHTPYSFFNLIYTQWHLEKKVKKKKKECIKIN